MEVVKIIVLPVMAFLVVIYGLVTWECSSYQSATGKATKMAGTTCYVQDAGQWFAWEEYKHRLVANGVRL